MKLAVFSEHSGLMIRGGASLGIMDRQHAWFSTSVVSEGLSVVVSQTSAQGSPAGYMLASILALPAGACLWSSGLTHTLSAEEQL